MIHVLQKGTRAGLPVLVFVGFILSSHATSKDYRGGLVPALGVMCAIPPALIVVTDSAGNRSGVDVSKPVSAVGIGTVLDEIPLSRTEQVNIGSDDAATLGAPGPTTSWQLDLGMTTPQTYTISLTGVTVGVSEVLLAPDVPEIRYLSPRTVFVLVSPRVVRTLSVRFDPSSRTMTAAREVQAGGLSEDIGSACKLKLVTSDGVCQSLTAKADAAGAALKRGQKNAAAGSLRALLSELKAQAGKHVKEPALTILREETEVLLAQVSSRSTRKAKRP